MLRLTRLNGKELFINPEMVKFIEATPDTLLTLSTGDKIMVKEEIEDIIEAFMNYKRAIHQTVVNRALEI